MNYFWDEILHTDWYEIDSCSTVVDPYARTQGGLFE
jgi:hypothetical protein